MIIFLISLLVVVIFVSKAMNKKISAKIDEMFDFYLWLYDMVSNHKPSVFATNKDFDILKKIGIYCGQPIVLIENMSRVRYAIIKRLKKRHNFTAVGFGCEQFGKDCIILQKNFIETNVFCALNKCSNTIEKQLIKTSIDIQQKTLEKYYKKIVSGKGEEYYLGYVCNKLYYFPKIIFSTQIVIDYDNNSSIVVNKKDNAWLIFDQISGRSEYVMSNLLLNTRVDDYSKRLLITIPPCTEGYVVLFDEQLGTNKSEFNNIKKLYINHYKKLFNYQINSNNKTIDNYVNNILRRKTLEELLEEKLFVDYKKIIDNYYEKIHSLLGVKFCERLNCFIFDNPSIKLNCTVYSTVDGKVFRIHIVNSNENKLVVGGANFYNLNCVGTSELKKSGLEICYHF